MEKKKIHKKQLNRERGKRSMEEEKFDLSITCWNCEKKNGIPDELLDMITKVEEIKIGLEYTVSTDDAIDYIFNELSKDGFVPNTSAIRQVLRYFYEFIMYKANYEEEK
jgi:hypothetical protein